MRTRYIVAAQENIVALMDLTSSLLICEPSEADKQRAHDAIETVRELLINGASPFLAYRRDILGGPMAEKLQDLSMFLFGGGKLSFYHLFGGLDESGVRIGLELIASYVTNGENDRDFMLLCAEIHDMREADKRRERALETAD